jgi:uncharacterized protein (TIRG00374 family)
MHGQFVRLMAIALTLAVSAVFGFFAIRGIRLGATWDALRASNYWWLLPSLAALAGSVAVRVFRWQTLFHPARRPPLGSLTRATILGLFFNSIMPARGGDIVRIVALKKYAGTSRAETTATIAVERVFDVCSLVVLLFALLAWLPRVSWLEPAAIAAFACLCVIAVLVVLGRLVANHPVASNLRVLARLPWLREEMVSRLFRNLSHGLTALSRPRQAFAALGLTFLSWLLLGLSFWLLMVGFDLGLSPLAGLLVVIATGVAFIIPAAPAAVGVFEAAGLAVTSAYGIARSPAFAYILVLHLLNFAPFVLAGLLVLGADARARRLPARAPGLRSRG